MGGGVGAPPHGLTPVLRLLALLAIVVALLVFFGLLLQSCASTSKHSAAKSYFDKAAVIAKSSQDNGTAVANALITPARRPTDLAAKLSSYAEQERQNVTSAENLNPPGKLRDEHQQMIEALQLRVSGVQGLADTFAANPDSKTHGEATVLSEQADRLIASDIVWEDLYRVPATARAEERGDQRRHDPELPVRREPRPDDGALDVAPPDPAARDDDRRHADGHPRHEHRRREDTAGRPDALPDRDEHRRRDDRARVRRHDPGLRRLAGGRDQGDADDPEAAGAIVRTKTVALINPGQTKSITFGDLGQVPFAQKTTVHVDVATVPGEHNTDNNKASFPVIFSLG